MLVFHHTDNVTADANPTAGEQRVQCGQKRVTQSPVPDTACRSTHRRQVRLVIRVDEGLGCRLHPLQRLCQTHRRTPSYHWRAGGSM